jgi:hypothetical protein
MDRGKAGEGSPTAPGWYNVAPRVQGVLRGAWTVRVYANRKGDLVFAAGKEAAGKEPERRVTDAALSGWRWQGPFTRESEAMNALGTGGGGGPVGGPPGGGGGGGKPT